MGLASSAAAFEEHGAVGSLEAPQLSVELAQINSVNELSDVSPEDWAYTALQILVEQFQCLEGYPDGTFRGDQSLTRYEFAAALSACFDNALVAHPVGRPDASTTIRRLQEEFAAELATLRGRVDALEAETAELREQQFSTTTKLRGEAVAHVVVPFDELDIDEDPDLSDDTTTFTTRARLTFDASFTGEDRLRVRLQAGEDDFGVLPAALETDDDADGGFTVEIDDFYYQFPIGNLINAEIAANGRSTDDFVTSTIVPFDGDSVSQAGEPAFYDFDAGGGGFGAGLSFALTDNIVLDAAYSGSEGESGTNDNNDGGILGADDQAYIIQLNYLSDGLIDAAVTYIRGNDGDDEEFTDVFAGLVNLDFGRFFVAGHVAYLDNDDDDDFSWQAGAGINDFLIEGSQLAAYYSNLPDFDDDPFVIEGYWQLPVNEFLTITPAIIYGDLDVGGEDENLYGAIRAKFSF
ncbi:MAG: iron uptake porin [Cyanobacteria bacterium J06559_3]